MEMVMVVRLSLDWYHMTLSLQIYQHAENEGQDLALVITDNMSRTGPVWINRPARYSVSVNMIGDTRIQSH